MPKRKKSFQRHTSPVGWGKNIPSAAQLRVSAGVALIVLVAVIAYFPSISGGFVLDDDLLLTENNLVKAPDGIYQFWCTTKATDYWPATNATLWIEWRLWGMNSAGYHVTNLILHIVESLLVWLILRKLSHSRGVFGGCDLRPASGQRGIGGLDRLAKKCDVDVVLPLVDFVLFEGGFSHPPWRSAAGGYDIHCPIIHPSSFILHPFTAGIGSAWRHSYWRCSARALWLCCRWYCWGLSGGSAPLTRWDVVRTAPFFLVAAVLAGVNMWFQTHGMEVSIRSAGFIERLLGAGGVVWFYLYKAFLPVDLSFIYPQWNIQSGSLLWWLPLLAALLLLRYYGGIEKAGAGRFCLPGDFFAWPWSR